MIRLLRDGYFVWPALGTVTSLALTLQSAMYFDMHGVFYHSIVLIFVSVISLMFFAGLAWFTVMIGLDATANYPEFYVIGQEIPIIEFPRVQIKIPVEQPEVIEEEAKAITVKHPKTPGDLKDLGEALLKHKHGEVIE